MSETGGWRGMAHMSVRYIGGGGGGIGWRDIN